MAARCPRARSRRRGLAGLRRIRPAHGEPGGGRCGARPPAADLTGYGAAAEDVAAAVDLVRADPRVDEDRVALWFFSGGGLLSADWLAAPPPWLRCVAATYPTLAPLPGWGLAGTRFRPAAAIDGAGRLPVVLTRVGQENPQIAATVEEFLTTARASGAAIEVVDVPDAPHAFETVDRSAQAREAVHHAVRSVLAQLRS